MYLGACGCGDCGNCRTPPGMGDYIDLEPSTRRARGARSFLGDVPWWQQLITAGGNIAQSVINRTQYPTYGNFPTYPTFPTPTFPTNTGYPSTIQYAEPAPAETTNWLPWALGAGALFLLARRR
jgi:hypothetical protein